MPQQQKFTLNDVARNLGLLRATVSLVLRNSPLVKAETRAGVEAEIQQIGYIYDRAAAKLRARSVSSVGLIINDLSNPFVAELAVGVDEALAAIGFVTLLGSAGESVEHQQAVLASLVEHAPAGIILSPAEGSQGEAIARAVGAHVPILVFNRALDGDWDFRAMDNHRGAYLTKDHPIALGHRRIAFFGGHRDSSSCRERRDGYLAALADARLTGEPQWRIEAASTRVEAARHAGALCVREPVPTEDVCYNEAVALGLRLGLVARGRRPRRRLRSGRIRRDSGGGAQHIPAHHDRDQTTRTRTACSRAYPHPHARTFAGDRRAHRAGEPDRAPKHLPSFQHRRTHPK